jgi:hypothetical protein
MCVPALVERQPVQRRAVHRDHLVLHTMQAGPLQERPLRNGRYTGGYTHVFTHSSNLVRPSRGVPFTVITWSCIEQKAGPLHEGEGPIGNVARPEISFSGGRSLGTRRAGLRNGVFKGATALPLSPSLSAVALAVSV